MSHQQVTLIATLRAKPGFERRLGELLLPMVEPSRAEPGCLNYDVHQSDRDPAVWVIYENWRSRADLDAHFQLPHFLKLAAELPAVLAGEVDMHYLTMKSPYRQR
jgi:quinol monooxygenase YgiN